MQLWNRIDVTSTILTALAWGVLTTSAVAGTGPSRDPTGETAHYEVDRSSSRTSSVVRSGNMDATVTRALPDHPDGPAYETKLDYDFVLQILGRRRGSETMAAPAAYFTPDFMTELRRTGRYQTPEFKVRHVGYAHARNMDGNVYSNCDKIEIYDIRQYSMLAGVARQLLSTARGVPEFADIQDLVILAHVKEGKPVLGAVKLDVSGVYEGVRVKAGADYEAP